MSGTVRIILTTFMKFLLTHDTFSTLFCSLLLFLIHYSNHLDTALSDRYLHLLISAYLPENGDVLRKQLSNIFCYESITIHTVESYIPASDTRYKLCIYSSKYIAGDSKIIFSKIINGTYENFNNAHIRK